MLGLALGFLVLLQGPPALDPFGTRGNVRDDALPGVLEMSDGTIHRGQVFLTRDARLKVLDEATKKHREVPLDQVRSIECEVLKEWVEKEWRFLENANDQKVYTGRTYPSREYAHKITLSDGRTLRGRLSALMYVQEDNAKAPVRYLLHQRDKGEPGTDLKALAYVRSVRLGDAADKDDKPRKETKGPAKPPAKRGK